MTGGSLTRCPSVVLAQADLQLAQPGHLVQHIVNVAAEGRQVLAAVALDIGAGSEGRRGWWAGRGAKQQQCIGLHMCSSAGCATCSLPHDTATEATHTEVYSTHQASCRNCSPPSPPLLTAAPCQAHQGSPVVVVVDGTQLWRLLRQHEAVLQQRLVVAQHAVCVAHLQHGRVITC